MPLAPFLRLRLKSHSSSPSHWVFVHGGETMVLP
uniref:Uncharacterized protein n=1 Tax=Anguilla anguilla TaxID=7936 RepID=A0A0E9P961_ANGAN